MKQLCGSVSRAARKPPRRSTTDSAKTTRRKESQELATSRMAGIVQPCCNHSHRETRKCVWKCVPRTQRLSSPEETIVAPSVTRQHTMSNARNQQCKYNEERRMIPRAVKTFTHSGHRAATSSFQHGTQARVLRLPKQSCRPLRKYFRV
ncbi:hypothetical protein TcCL_ESM09081 [Trypanosoma cruzi]|nr:hypothetical protein TcCL_ESM09081 [Trypanosoma cruzi]